MNITEERHIINKGRHRSQDIPALFPEFYSKNKDRIDSGKIKFFDEPWAIEGGVLVDTENNETIFVNFKA